MTAIIKTHLCIFLAGMVWNVVPVWGMERFCFRVWLKDKGVAEQMTETPETFLSKEAIARRRKRNVEITLSDVPVATAYLDALVATGCRIVTKSKWMATVVVECEDRQRIEQLKKLPFVDSVCCVWRGSYRLEERVTCAEQSLLPETPEDKLPEAYYGHAARQIEMLNGTALHNAGWKGQGMRVAVIDAGFENVHRISAFASLQLLGTYNVISPESDVFCEDSHGAKVLSCMAANQPGVMVGTAPGAAYLLIKSEDPRAEYPVEEDFWAAAVEYADSFGVDVITSSLGYSRFDLPEANGSPDGLDGRTAFISRVAGKVAEKGMLLFCSAGNEGKHEWGKITFPADAFDVVTVGAAEENGTRCAFSSTGFTADYRLKPDVLALGADVCVIGTDGHTQFASGTSFSTPIVAGLGVCLWQALPWLDGLEIKSLLLQTASHSEHPDAERGYGVPDLVKAYKKELNESL